MEKRFHKLSGQGLQELYKGAKIIETLENYSLADPVVTPILPKSLKRDVYIYSDEEFWKEVIQNPITYWKKEICLDRFVVCDWIARVPGLYWSKASMVMRQDREQDIDMRSREWKEFYPPGKSRKILGGVGTLLLPPLDDGKVLISVSSGCNASTGIPILVYPDVIDAFDIRQGDLVRINNAMWLPMSEQWSAHFATTAGIPRGYLVVDTPDKINIVKRNCPIEYHPFTLMEYEDKDALKYDFVFVSVDSKVRNAEMKITEFFESYAKKDGRNGQYLINSNLVSPIFPTRYSSPSELRDPSEKANVKLLHERVKESHFKAASLEVLIERLPKHCQTSTAIRTLATNVGVNVALLKEDSAARMSAQLIILCIEKNIVEQLIDRLVLQYPLIFN
jgi:hypothetical protein